MDGIKNTALGPRLLTAAVALVGAYLLLLTHLMLGGQHEAFVTPKPPSVQTALITALGDRQFALRITALQLQNLGDSVGKFTALTHYDYSRIKEWLVLLDAIDNRSNFAPAIASYYYGAISQPEKIMLMVDYLHARGASDVEKNWWWLVQAVTLAQNIDRQRALLISRDLMRPGVPLWAQSINAALLMGTG